MNLDLLTVMSLFYIYTMIGWVWESCYESVLNKKWINRGSLNGPYIPIYGFGGLFILFVLQRFQAPILSKTTLLVFVIGAVGASSLEYLTSLLLEKIFHTRWWDYTNYPLNVNGRICLIATFFWGVVAVCAINYLNPFLLNWYNNRQHDTMLIFVSVMSTLFAVDIAVTVNSILDLRARIKNIKIPKFAENPFMVRIIEAFPKLRFVTEKEQKAFNMLKEKIFHRKK